MRIIFATLLVAVFLLTFWSCTSKQPTPTPTSSQTISSTQSTQSITKPKMTAQNIPIRLMTAQYAGEQSVPGPRVSASIWAPLATYAFMNTQGVGYPGKETSQQLHDLGLNVMPYSDPNHWSGEKVGVDNYFIDSDIARACDGTKITIYHPGQKTVPYFIDVRQPHVAVAWKAWLTDFQKHGGVADTVFEDTSDNSTWYATRPTGPCAADGHSIVSAADWTAATEKNEAAFGAPVLFNGLNSGPSVALLSGPAIGGEQETCFSNWTNLTNGGPYTPSLTEWLQSLSNEIAAKANNKHFLCGASANGAADTTNAIAYRLFMIGSLDLDQDPMNDIVSWHWTTSSGVNIMPEADLVLMNPVKADPTTPTDLLVGSVYVREYAHCYIKGKEIISSFTGNVHGGCGIVVNANGRKSYPNPLTGYKRTLVLQGSDILDGGAIVVSSTVPPTTLLPSTAVVEFR